jgi:hypothetical protein
MPEKQTFEIPQQLRELPKRISNKRGRLTASSWMP